LLDRPGVYAGPRTKKQPPVSQDRESPGKGAFVMMNQQADQERASYTIESERTNVPQLYQVVIECQHEAEQRAWFERLRGEGVRVRLLVL
jgi:hypothetical protein